MFHPKSFSRRSFARQAWSPRGAAPLPPAIGASAGRLQGLYFNQPRPVLPAQLARQRHRRDELLWLKP
ncbi:MAG: hypothetical protein IPN53_08870 [Comamonadaceae bacterium]|nr:hypothetical protein [Comamonadaceae bacterium]